MALIVEDGTGLTTAESYVSVDDANTYLVARAVPSAWEDAGVTDRERALRNATEWLDRTYELRWRGKVQTGTQALSWPRSGAYDRNEYYIASDSVPTELERATAKVAVAWLEDADNLTPGDTDTSDLESETVSIPGGPRHTKKWRGASGIPSFIGEVEGILRHIVRDSNEAVRG